MKHRIVLFAFLAICRFAAFSFAQEVKTEKNTEVKNIEAKSAATETRKPEDIKIDESDARKARVEKTSDGKNVSREKVASKNDEIESKSKSKSDSKEKVDGSEDYKRAQREPQ